ncbi:SpoIIE family protein phosphatase [Nonomuraea sp. M3C6]|uniref:SpoIIE family protein phosphatase n=1 Tax=Nonomuraea marmarensis TaxID=3351344 RepID=A0ABW7A6Q6_9ACTN
MAAPDTTAGGAAEENIPAVAVIDDEGTVIGWTQAAEDLLGYRPAEVLNRSGAVLLMPGDRAARISDWAGRFGDREHWSGLAETRHRDGHRVLVRVEASRLRVPEGTDAWLLSATAAAAKVTERAASLLEPFINRSPLAMALWDRDLRCVWLNDAARSLQRVFPHYRVGRSLAEPLPGTDVEAAAGAMRRVFTDGNPMIDREARWVSPDGLEERTLSTSLFRLEGVDGRPLGVCSQAIDMSHSRARDRLALLREASIRIGSTLDIQKTAQELADLAVPVLADYVTVDLAESALPDVEPLQRLPATDVSIPVFRRLGVASIHEGVPESLWAVGEAVFVPPSSPFTEVLASGRPHYEEVLDISPGTWLDQDPARAEIIHGTRMHSLIVVPLKARGELLGVTVFVRNDNAAAFTKDDLMIAEELCVRAALSLDNARRYTRERTAALALQRHLLPRNLTGGGAVEVASRYLPSDIHDGVGGDWFDAIPLRGDRIALVVGDVTGHGINAAARMGRLQTAVRTLAYMDLPPAELLTHLDALIAKRQEEEETDGYPLIAMGATCLYAVYDPATRRCTMAAAGHPPPALVDPTGDVSFPDLPSGTPIGLGIGPYESLELELAEGTLIALYTDGLIETREADIDTGMDRLRAALARAVLPLENLCTQVIDTMVGGTSSEDDVALLVARTLVSDR